MRYKTVRSLASFLCLIRFWVNVPPALPGVQEKMWRQGVLASQSRLFKSNAILFALSWKSSQMCCWCLHIKFCNIGRSSYCVEVKPRPWKIPPPLEVDSADLAEQIWLKIAGGWKKGLTSFWWALNEALSDSWHVKKMSADLLSIFCRSSLFLSRRPCKNGNEQTICETLSSLWYEVTLMCRPRPKLSCIVHRSLCGSFCRQLRISRSDVIAQEPNLLPHYIKKHIKIISHNHFLQK